MYLLRLLFCLQYHKNVLSLNYFLPSLFFQIGNTYWHLKSRGGITLASWNFGALCFSHLQFYWWKSARFLIVYISSIYKTWYRQQSSTATIGLLFLHHNFSNNLPEVQHDSYHFSELLLVDLLFKYNGRNLPHS